MSQQSRFENDPTIKRAVAERRVRNGLWRSAILWSPLFLLCGGAFIYFLFQQLFSENGEGWFLLVILGILSLLFGYQSVQSIRDLRGGKITAEGYITRHWSRTDSLVMRSHYLRLGTREIFRVDKVQHQLVKSGDYVPLDYSPATMIVVTVDKKEPPDDNPTLADYGHPES